MKKKRYFSFFLWGFLFFNIYAVLGGAFVRATHSGAGCGAHWPLCNGQILPSISRVQTLIEFVHRISSGIILIATIVTLVISFLFYPKKHFIRKSSIFILIFVIIEALVGAALVYYGWVYKNASPFRALVVSIHLMNTLLLIGSISLAAFAVSKEIQISNLNNFSIDFIYKKNIKNLFPSLITLFIVFIICVTGAVTALGDTLYQPKFVGENIIRDLENHENFIKTIRIFHPLLAIGLALLSLHFVWKIYEENKDELNKDNFSLFTILVFLQIIVGFLNIFLLVPVWSQLIHLFIACVLWVIAIRIYFELFFEPIIIEQPQNK